MIALVIAMLGVSNVLHITVSERTTELAILRAIGWLSQLAGIASALLIVVSVISSPSPGSAGAACRAQPPARVSSVFMSISSPSSSAVVRPLAITYERSATATTSS